MLKNAKNVKEILQRLDQFEEYLFNNLKIIYTENTKIYRNIIYHDFAEFRHKSYCTVIFQ